MRRARSILVGVDFSEPSRSALAQALRIGAWGGAVVRAVHVVEPELVLEIEGPMMPLVADDIQGRVRDARATWESFATDLPGRAGVAFDVLVGSPADALRRRAAESSADLLVVGSRGRQHAEHGVGVQAMQCVRQCAAPVLVTSAGHVGAFRRIMACIDFSAASREALDHAARLAVQDSASLHVVHVYAGPWRRPRFKPPLPETPEAFQRRYGDAVTACLAEFARPLDAEIDWLKPSYTVVEHDHHAAALIAHAKQIGADLMVLGVRGRTNLREMLMGSTAERVLRSVGCSVLAVKPTGAV